MCVVMLIILPPDPSKWQGVPQQENFTKTKYYRAIVFFFKMFDSFQEKK